MKLVGIVGSNAPKSYNRMLLQFIQKHFNDKIDIDLIEIDKVPMFNQSNDQTESNVIQEIAGQILQADGVIIATPEHNHTIPAALKSLIEWLSYKIHPFENKPVMIVGASYFSQGSSRAQLSLRVILDSPGVNAIVLPGNEFLLGNVKEAFDDEGNIKDAGTVNFLASCLENFIRFIKVVSQISEAEEADNNEKLPEEDLFAKGTIVTTIEGVDMVDNEWVEKASQHVQASSGSQYIQLDRGILTVDQLNSFLNSMPMELTFADSNNQFIYYNNVHPAEEMLAKRYPEQVGNPIGECHPDRTHKNVKWVISQLRSGKEALVRVHVPTHGPDKYVVHHYQAMRDNEGNYMGINEYILDLKPTIDWYLQQTGQELVGGTDTVSGASKQEGKETDAVSGASQNTTKSHTKNVNHQADVVSAASQKEKEAETTIEVDTVTSASTH